MYGVKNLSINAVGAIKPVKNDTPANKPGKSGFSDSIESVNNVSDKPSGCGGVNNATRNRSDNQPPAPSDSPASAKK